MKADHQKGTRLFYTPYTKRNGKVPLILMTMLQVLYKFFSLLAIVSNNLGNCVLGWLLRCSSLEKLMLDTTEIGHRLKFAFLQRLPKH